ncbi:hypothetical protein Mal64_18180 [Pseudobythopirellula maris]|uniref:Uncharacterized protein n=1 Tax=Pseudobythopirellula maris TaxID=2527991 RepID=A0A5C5ZLR4_9BACT|nr:hypothetical protein [Pseudobythopirellula maris]TWT88339.1 hypothetical protein Mal64_18180 [Pseudobythopirellula maris]
MSQPSQNPYAYNDGNGEQAPPVYKSEKEPKGCFFYGCLFAAIGAALVVVVVIVAGVAGYYFLTGQIDKYTATEPAEIPISNASDEQIAELQSRFDRLIRAVDADGEEDADDGAPAEADPAGEDPAAVDNGEISFSADELNALIASNDDLRGRVFIRIEDGQVSGDISIPLDEMPLGAGRFLNATVSLELGYKDGVPVVKLAGGSVKGEPLPEQFIDALSQENMAEDILEDPDVAETLSKFESIEVVEDRLILRLSRPQDGPNGAAESEPATPDDAPPLSPPAQP